MGNGIGISVPRECRSCGYRWSDQVPPLKGGKILVMDRPISVPDCRACRDEDPK